MSEAGPRPEEASWYAGRFARRRGSHGAVDALALTAVDGWARIPNPRGLFPKLGQVEIQGIAVLELRPGDWLAFQIVPNARRGAPSFRVSTHRLLPRYVDMTELGSIQAARTLFAEEGWAGGNESGHWAVRFSEDRLLVLDLAGEMGSRLRLIGSAQRRVPCYEFDAARIVPQPGIADSVQLYDLGDAAPQTVHDWSADADYIAHVVRSLAGESDPRLDELIIWLELHRDERTGRVSATGVDPQRGFEALRSGELAARLSADKALMTAYLAAVRNDPGVAKVVAQAAHQAAMRDRETVIAALRSELATAHQIEKDKQDEALRERERALNEALDRSIEARGEELERELQVKLKEAARDAEACVAEHLEKLRAEVTTLTTGRDALLAQRQALSEEVDKLRGEVAALEEKRRLSEQEWLKLSSAAAALATRTEMRPHAVTQLPSADDDRGTPLAVGSIAGVISHSPLLTATGKVLMERFVVLLLAGEFPLLVGAQADDFALVAERLIAARRLVPFELDATILTADDIWSRPGSGIVSPVAQAATRAQDGGETFLVALRGIERSAARAWYPALAALIRQGLLPRRLMLFATVIDQSCEEAQALPGGAYRLDIQNAIEPRAALIAPALFGSGPSAVSFELDPGDRASDLASALPILSQLGSGLSLELSLRVARVALETMRIRPGDAAAALLAAREFCAATRRQRTIGSAQQGGRTNA